MSTISGFTALKDPKIDSKVRQDMAIITKETVRVLGKVDSIILVGSFGRGEGSVRFNSKGEVFPVNDYDLMVITNQKVTEQKYALLLRSLHEKVVVETSNKLPGNSFSISLQIVPKRRLRALLPDTSTIDMKKASKVVFGEDVRALIPFDCTDIPLSSGIILLFNKIVGLLQQVDPSFLGNEISFSKRQMLTYQCARTYMEIAAALLIFTGDYVPSYSEKSRIFARIYQEKLPLLFTRLPNLSEKIQNSTRMKLYSDFDRCNVDPIELWFGTRKDLLEVFRFCITRFLDIAGPKRDLISLLPEIYTKNSKLFKDYLSKTHWRTLVRIPPIAIGLEVLDNVRFFRKLWFLGRELYPRVMLSRKSPLVNIYHASLLGLLAIEKQQRIDQRFLYQAIGYLQQAYPLKESSDLLIMWHNFRVTCLSALKLYFLKEKVGL